MPLEYNLWSEFNYFELTENVRQKNDSAFAEMLKRIRIGITNQEDVDILESKRIVQKNVSEATKIESAVEFIVNKLKNGCYIICLCPTLEKTELINNEVIKAFNIITVNIPAQDTESFINSKSKLKKKSTNAYLRNNIKKKISETAGLESNLIIGINSRVMLRRNIDVNRGLCNGALGTVTKINMNSCGNYVQNIIVIFDCNKNSDFKETVIERINSDFEIRKNIYANRSQFPLTLAWAITIHKCQGITLDHVLIDLGQDIFESGQAYVALSRGKEIKNIHLIDFDSNILKCNKKALKEYNRLRYKFTNLPLFATTDCVENHNSKKIKKSLSSELKSLKNLPSINEQKSPIKNLQKKKKRRLDLNNQRSDTFYDTYFLKMTNSNNGCYCNSIVQALLSFGKTFFDIVRFALKIFILLFMKFSLIGKNY